MKKTVLILLVILLIVFGIFTLGAFSADIENPYASMDVEHQSNTGNPNQEKIDNNTKNKNPTSENINPGVNNISTVYPYNDPNWKDYNITIRKNYLNLSDGDHYFLYTDIPNIKSNSTVLVDNGTNIHIEKDNKTSSNNIYFLNDKQTTLNVKYKDSNKTYQLHNITVYSGFGTELGTNKFIYGYCVEGYDDFEKISEDTFKKYTYKLYGQTYSSSSGLKANKYGDCWGFSEYLYESLANAGYTVRVIEYPTLFSKNHRSVQIMLTNNSWTAFPYREYGWSNYYDKELNNDKNETNSSLIKVVMTNENKTNRTGK
ncbi:hypothetical protein [uncultured Methanobrevibacter sp.]|uniref:hypothetical protein n=1 Tax=uncultured Methanobrevibacter sp. TaxID=253161 RepID=UPI00258671CF|nr:hypothetical protein [uncultured Methanobrevibacter sp.]